MLQAPVFQCLAFDPFSLSDDSRSPAEVGIGGCYVVEALVVPVMIVMFDESLDLAFEIAGQEVIFQQNTVFQRLMPALDLALGLWMERRAAHMVHLPGVEIFGQFPRDVAGAVIRQKPGPVQHIGMIAA